MEFNLNKLKSTKENALSFLSYRSLLGSALFLGLAPLTLTADGSKQDMSNKVSLFDADKTTSSLSSNEYSSSKREKYKKQDSSTGFYIGAFGGGGSSNPFEVTQKGTAFYFEAAGGPLAVDAEGHTSHSSVGFVGLHVGYEWLHRQPSYRQLTHAVELEGFYESTTKKANNLINPTDRLPEHQFKDKFPINMGVALVNWNLIWNNRRLHGFCPYFGLGMGAALLSIYHAQATQVAPPEVGVNHFNSDRHAATCVFAAQIKAGARYDVAKYFRLFAEYRFLYLSPSNYTFGSVKYPGHVATSPWTVDFESICNNMFALGFDIPL